MEHPGTSNNYDTYEKKMRTIKFWACSRDRLERSDWSCDMFSFRKQNNFASKMNPHLGTLHCGKSIEKYLRSLIIDDILRGGGNVSTEHYPGSFRAIGSKYKVLKRCYQFQMYGRHFVKREKISVSMLRLVFNRKGWQNQN